MYKSIQMHRCIHRENQVTNIAPTKGTLQSACLRRNWGIFVVVSFAFLLTLAGLFWVAGINKKKEKLPECHKKQITLTNPPHPLQTTETIKKFSCHEYVNISQRSQRLFEELPLLFLAINSTNNFPLSHSLGLSVFLSLAHCLSFSFSHAVYEYGNRVNTALSSTPRMDWY